MAFPFALVAVCLVLPACGADPTTSAAYIDLASVIDGLEQDLSVQQAALAAITEEHSGLEQDVAQARTVLATTSDAAATASVDKEAADTERRAALDELVATKAGSPGYLHFLTAAFDVEVTARCEAQLRAGFGLNEWPTSDGGFPDQDLIGRDLNNEAGVCFDAGAADSFATIERLCATAYDAGSVNKDPDAYAGQCFTGQARVFQYDSITGPCAFLADVDSGFTTLFSTFVPPDGREGCDFLAEVEEGSQIRFWAGVVGTYSYETSMGGSNTIPELNIIMQQGTG